MTEIKKSIKEVLDKSGIEYAYLERKKGTFPYITYTYQELKGSISDNRVEVEIYDIYINLFVVSSLDTNTQTLKRLLSEAQYILADILPPETITTTDEKPFYQIVLNYKKHIYVGGK